MERSTAKKSRGGTASKIAAELGGEEPFLGCSGNRDQSKRNQLLGLDSEWSSCQRCPLGATAFKHVLYELPSGFTPNKPLDVLFIGEAPGRTENVLGTPFCGKSGKFLRSVIEEVNTNNGNDYGIYYGFSNLLACRPTDSQGNDRPPQMSEVDACHGRLVSLLGICEPRAIVGLGRVPEQFLPRILSGAGWQGVTAWLRHPAYILRTGGRNSDHFPAYVAGFRELFEKVGRSCR